jgi:hypothetical protein
MTFLLRTRGDPGALAAAARGAVAGVDPGLAVLETETLTALLDQSLWHERLFGRLFTAFGAAALVLALVGLYGVVAHATGQRTHEIGGARRARRARGGRAPARARRERARRRRQPARRPRARGRARARARLHALRGVHHRRRRVRRRDAGAGSGGAPRHVAPRTPRRACGPVVALRAD